jgi:glyoxylase-like metal-dependent hydrolase (beta-lactamase superfamily II)
VTFERGFDADPLRSYLTSLRAVADLRPRQVLPGHGTPFADPLGRIEAILRTKVRRLQKIRRAIGEQASLDRRARRPARRPGDPRAPAPACDQRDAGARGLPALVGVVERRTRPDGVYEWYATADTPLDVAALTAPDRNAA